MIADEKNTDADTAILSAVAAVAVPAVAVTKNVPQTPTVNQNTTVSAPAAATVKNNNQNNQNNQTQGQNSVQSVFPVPVAVPSAEVVRETSPQGRYVKLEDRLGSGAYKDV